MRLPHAALAADLAVLGLVLSPPVEAQTPQKLRFQASFPSSSLIFENFKYWAELVKVMLGAAYALLQGAHVRTDMLWEKFSDRKKGVIDSVAYVLFFLPSMAILFAISIDDFFYALSINEKSTSSLWQPVIWPLRAVIPMAAALLFLQGISELMKSLWAARTGAMLVHHEKIEV
jgi:TRAP-type mannitol/chloroaromatic compound transport system permease small subunit